MNKQFPPWYEPSKCKEFGRIYLNDELAQQIIFLEVANLL